ncbi:alpha/beta hydrolase [Actinobacillus pleuropneumoniae]|uniref:Alpha/beta hydrolase n=1 Tax=Actinobacillus pleuropneumoniae TaxID=715 RepID=A0A9Q4H5I2_ACTPL|nr:alpha/beta hydrolase [Actinobacillus pleuropneumoniae]MCL7721801.1 alpha/beta hydrolase [Actinobacillus pleuropneumoniae]MCL7728127.1 alpha/beta hydrolase [Actinobacillus pleuropneumoniae]MCL7729789.1 alpha/beta hydrolase [Actinobacillus pleuropneumoniae]MCY6367834.1 alpha/beta hydrolase [Actinobacillus pleuropneumoniae]MCY6384703.1 alpha/beta hydrolase [Actinobacillus pleuropneumoniae]
MKIRTKLTALSSALLLGSTFIGGNAMANLPQSATVVEVPAQTIQLTQEWDKIFPKSDKVEHLKVTFKNRYGITLVGDLYVPKNAKGKLAAIAISGPFGAVKEQTSGLYAQHMAERGFITVAFDGSYTGESSGLPRNVPSPEINTEDFSAAVDFLGSLENVDREKIGILGICGWGGFALNAAISDTRVKAVAVSTMYDMTRVNANGYEIELDPKGQYDRVSAQTAEERYKMKEGLNNARWEAMKDGYATLLPANNLDPKKDITAKTPKFFAEYANFYRTERGFHPRSVNSNPEHSWTTTAFLPFINMPILKYAAELKAPALVVHGEKAHSRYFGEDAFKALGSKNKELVIVEGASHTDLYDDVAGKIPYDKFEQFFKANLK